MARFRVILVDPLYGGNVGHAARSMMNFGITELALVQGVSIGDDARDRAVHAQVVLDRAMHTTTLDQAAEGCDLLVGFTARMTGREAKFRRNPLDLRDWAPLAAVHPGRIGLVFGREDRGLTNEEADRCDQLVTIPTHEMYRSLNLAHAVTVACYALHEATGPERVKSYTPAEKKDLDRLILRFHRLMEQSDYPAHRRATIATMFQRLIARAQPTALEMSALLGVFKDILFHLGVRRERPPGESTQAYEDQLDDAALAEHVAKLLGDADAGPELTRET